MDEVKGNCKPSDLQLSYFPIWARVYNLPFKGRLNMANVKAIGEKIGTFVKLDNSGAVGIDKSIRIRVLHNVHKPLVTNVKVKMKNGVEESFEVKYERPPLFCFFCGKVGHGTKDCDDDVDNEEQEIKFGGWLKASPWKVGSSGGDSSDVGQKRSIARALFITKPKQNAEEKATEEVEDIVDRMIRWEIKEGRKVVEKQRGEMDNSKARDESINMVGLNHERQATQVEEVHSPLREQNAKEGGSEKKIGKKWRRLGTKGSEKMNVGEVFGGNKRKTREEAESGIDLMELEEMRAMKKMGMTISQKSQEIATDETEQVAGPTEWALGCQ